MLTSIDANVNAPCSPLLRCFGVSASRKEIPCEEEEAGCCLSGPLSCSSVVSISGRRPVLIVLIGISMSMNAAIYVPYSKVLVQP